ncbi:MAG TPA: TauD/TfdA family dioxygenase [Polyangiaceae bacterium]
MKEVPRIEGPPRAALEELGAAVVHLEGSSADASASPWSFAEGLFGERVVMVERQPIRAVPGGRTFASSAGFTPLHTDSQTHFGVPASAQVLVCRRPAERGGESTLVDAWQLVAAVAEQDPELSARLFDEVRALRFYFGDVVGATVSRRRGHLFFTHAPSPPPGDATAARIQSWVDRAPRALVRIDAGDVLVVNNHRMLHGRLAFDGASRELVRLLVWLEPPWRAPDAIARRAREHETPADPAASRRLAVVLELLRGSPPGVLAAREKIPEAELYRWRDAALAGAGRALDEALPPDRR